MGMHNAIEVYFLIAPAGLQNRSEATDMDNDERLSLKILFMTAFYHDTLSLDNSIKTRCLIEILLAP
ncbi:hypothetical protein BM607_004745 [Shewanella sp. SACH]|nr:hypothetical protein BM607_004745 [Shewanella sp. SACH]